MIIFQLLDSRELLDRGFLILKELRTELTHCCVSRLMTNRVSFSLPT